MKYEFTMSDVLDLADHFAAYMLDDPTLAERDPDGEIVSNVPNVWQYKQKCRTNLEPELLGYIATHPNYASIFPADEQIIRLVIRIFEEFPLAGTRARRTWKDVTKRFPINKNND